MTEDQEKNRENSTTSDERVRELTDTLQRLQADFENYVKRSQQEVSAHAEYANARLLEKLLPVLDSFEMAIERQEASVDLARGLEMIYAQLWGILEKEGLRPIPTENRKFDPYFHEVLLIVEGTDEGRIVECLQKGYMFKEKVVRHAKVKILRKKICQSEKPSPTNGC